MRFSRLVVGMGFAGLISGCEIPPTPSDTFCLSASELAKEPVSNADIRARYYHWNLCEYDRARMMEFLDRLVAQDDPWALRAKGVHILRDDPREGRRLIERSAALGHEPAKRTLNVIDQAKPPT